MAIFGFSQNADQKKAPPAPQRSHSESSLPPLQLDGNAALHHLNQVINWYRHCATGVHDVGLPSDAIYEENAKNLASQVVQLAFQSAKAESALLESQQKNVPNQSAAATQQQRLDQLKTDASSKIEQLQSQIDDINKQLPKTDASKHDALVSQRDALDSEIGLQKARLDVAQKMSAFIETSGESGHGLEADINRLAQSIPEVLGRQNAQTPATTKPVSKPVLANSGGLIGEAMTLYDYMSAVHQIDGLIKQSDYTVNVVNQLRGPLRDALRSALAQSEQIANQAPATDSQQLQIQRKTFQDLTDRFKQLSGALVPLSQEIIVLSDSKTNLDEWRDSIARESKYILRSVLIRVGGILLALVAVFFLSEIWRRVTFRYISDPRRRRQFLVLRRVVIGFLFAVIITVGFVSQFSSLATFAGFITAGIAVGLQAVLLSVAAYFFIIGRYGIRVGDRISVAGITGDVVDIGLVRLYIMELAGTGLDFYPTGRIVVFSNSVLFQTGTPLFKQIPGTEYAWHEVVVTIVPNGNHKTAQEKLERVVNDVYSHYKDEIERQHATIERRVDIQIEMPRPEARLQFADAGLELLVRYPVEIRRAPDIDEEMTRKVLDMVETDTALKSTLSGNPKIRSAVKG
ncbi:MAG TPA: mechanosensitive ion channel protein MscS [Candidatus Eisenbacteria bacterium]|nr:mechanosensitive ion channel protein MscS [Candidatus Eisenbacteria bacterium]